MDNSVLTTGTCTVYTLNKTRPDEHRYRAKNYTGEEIEILMREAGKQNKTLRRRFDPSVTNEKNTEIGIGF